MEVGERGVRARAVGGNRAGEMRITRFLRNPKSLPPARSGVSVEEIISQACPRTVAAVAAVAGRHILAIQDTTTLRDDGGGCGIVAHPTIAIDRADGALLGLVHAELIFRPGGLGASRKASAPADRQSHRWLEGAAHAGLRRWRAGRPR